MSESRGSDEESTLSTRSDDALCRFPDVSYYKSISEDSVWVKLNLSLDLAFKFPSVFPSHCISHMGLLALVSRHLSCIYQLEAHMLVKADVVHVVSLKYHIALDFIRLEDA